MFFSFVGQLNNGVFILASGSNTSYIPRNTDTVVATPVSLAENVNLWTQWDNYNGVWKVYCSDSSFSGDIHCMVKQIN